MTLILVTPHAAKRFKQRKGFNPLTPNDKSGQLLAIQAMKNELFKNKPSKVVVDGDTYCLSYHTSVEGTGVYTIHTILHSEIKYTLKNRIKRKLLTWLNDW